MIFPLLFFFAICGNAVVNSVAVVQFHPVQRGVFTNAELHHGFCSAKLLNAELNPVEHIQGVQFRFIGSNQQLLSPKLALTMHEPSI